MGGVYARLKTSPELNWRLMMLGIFLACWLLLFGGAVEGHSVDVADGHQIDTVETPSGHMWRGCKWHMIYWYSAFLIVTAQMSNTVKAFYAGEGHGMYDLFKWYIMGVELPKLSDTYTGAVEKDERAQVGFFTLMTSAFITWIFAKSINNASIYGGRYGILGGIGYAGWYWSFHAAALVGYIQRTKYGFRSMPVCINRIYGPAGSICLNLALIFRLWNEIWSNSLVIAGFYGPYKSVRWWAAGIFSVIVPAIYVMMGGMRASLLSDMLQAGIGLIFLFVVLGMVGSEMGDTGLFDYEPPGGYAAGRGFVFFASSIQGMCSYPFHDPVLTDRAYLSKPKTMVKAFLVGGSIAMMFIVLFASIGIFGDFLAGGALCDNDAFSSAERASWQTASGGMNSTLWAQVPGGMCRCNPGDLPRSCGQYNKGAANGVAKKLGGALECFILFVMMTSSLSTLDSTFTSVAKLVPLELCGWCHLPGDKRDHRGPMAPLDPNVGRIHILIGRFAIVGLAIVGTLFMEAEGDAVKATTVSGLMVLGLGPPVYLSTLWKYNSSSGSGDGWKRAPLVMVLSFSVGVFFGGVGLGAGLSTADQSIKDLYQSAPMGYGAFQYYLGWTIAGQLSCLGAGIIGFIFHQAVPLTQGCDAEPSTEDPDTGERIPRAGYEAALAKQTAQAVSSTSAAEMVSQSTC